jgi:selenocysteine lyase/cysteine desulfurase
MASRDDLDALRAAYGAFLRPGRILLSGHSHQAWPDVARDAQIAAFDDAARFVDDKWEQAIFPLVDEVGRRVLARMGFAESEAIAFAESTHTLAYRLLSALDLGPGARVVTTTGEFHSLHRQLVRLEEDGLEVVWVEAAPRAGLTERLLAAITPGTALVAISAVLFEDAWILEALADVVGRAHAVGALCLVDAYHAFNVVPIDLGPLRERLYVTAGGYKYAAFGNGLSWMRLPADCTLRPRFTGWFSDFGGLETERRRAGPLRYGAGGARFAGATFEASAFYRARAVLDHWDRFGLDVPRLRALSVAQTRRILARLDEAGAPLELVSSRDDARRGGFVTVRAARATEAARALRARGVYVDARGDLLRMGPAPYLTDEEIDAGVRAVVEVVAP